MARDNIGIEYLDFEVSNGIAGKLAHHNNTYCTPCYFKEYASMIQRKIAPIDFKRLVRGQINRQKEYQRMTDKVLFHDRSLLSIISYLYKHFDGVSLELIQLLQDNALEKYFIISNTEDSQYFDQAMIHLPNEIKVYRLDHTDPETANIIQEKVDAHS